MAANLGDELVARVFVVMRDFPEDFDQPPPIASIDLDVIARMSEPEKDRLLVRLLEFARVHTRPRPIDEPIRGHTFLM